MLEAIPYQYPSVDQPVPIIYNDDTSGLWQDLNAAESLAGHELQDGNENDQDMVIDDYIMFGVQGFQAEAIAMLNPEWTVALMTS